MNKTKHLSQDGIATRGAKHMRRVQTENIKYNLNV
jgi:hypothetical protein